MNHQPEPSDQQTLDSTNRRTPPPIVYKTVNPIIKLILRSPFHSMMSHLLMLITFTGRKTGKEYTTPVGYHWDSDDLIVFTHHNWWKNLRDGGPVKVRLQGKMLEGWAEPTQDEDVILDHVQKFIEENDVSKLRRLGITLEEQDSPPDENELRRAIQGTVVIRIHLNKSTSAQ